MKFPVKPGLIDEFIEVAGPFTSAIHAEPGNEWFEWSRGMEDPNEFVFAEAFNDDAAEAHAASDHFRAEPEVMRLFLIATPKIISRTVGDDNWDVMGELRVDQPRACYP